MDGNNVIEVKDVTMRFNMSKERVDSLKEYIIKLAKHQLKFEEFIALNDVSLSIKKGEVVGIVGLNGSGKSTLLKVISGILRPSSGTAAISGSISPLIELGAGFDFDLTARENVFLNGAILGYSREYMQQYYDDIVEFSELGQFMDTPVKNFSSGMISRLAFGIATIGQPDLLIVDEVLSVGDFRFQNKCEERIRRMLDAGTTLLFVSHSIAQVKELCSKVVWLEHGNLRAFVPSEIYCEENENS